MLTFVLSGAAVVMNKLFKDFPIYVPQYKSLSPWVRATHDPRKFI